MDARYFQALLPSTDKVSFVELHPTLPWLACFDRNDYLTVWDWQKHEVVMECQLGSNTQLNRQDVELHSRAEADINFFGRQLAEYVAHNYTVGQATGKIRSVAFLDLDTIYWKAAMQTLYWQGPAAIAPSVAHLGWLADRRYLMVVGERVVMLLDLLSKRVKTIPAALPALGGKGFYDAALLLRDIRGEILPNPMIAIACGDSAIRVVDALNLTVQHVMVTSSNVPISCMTVIPCPNAGGDWLVVGDEKGTVNVFRPLGAGEAGPPVLSISHKDMVLSLLYIPWVDEAGTPQPRLGVVTSDNRITAYDVRTMKALYKVKVLESKLSVTGACVAAGAMFNERSARSVIVSTNMPDVFAFSAEDCKMPQVVMSLRNHVPVRTDKKGVKVYHIASHPLRPDVVAAATNAGVAILRTQQQKSFHICGLSKVVSFKQVEETQDEGLLIAPSSPTVGTDDSEESKARAVSFISLCNGALHGATFKAQSEDVEILAKAAQNGTSRDRAGVNDPPLAILPASRHGIATIEDGWGDLKANAAGTMVAVCYQSAPLRPASSKGGMPLAMPSVSKYRVFKVASPDGPATNWTCIDEGFGSQVEWHHTNDWLAVHAVPAAPDLPPLPSKKSKDAAVEAAIREAAAAAARASASSYVTVRDFQPSGVYQLCKVTGSNESAVVGVHGGALLGVVKTQGPPPGMAPNPGRRALHLYDWQTGLPAGIELPDPKFVSFSPTGEYAALAYSEGIDFYTMDSSFQHLTRVGIRNATSAIWNGLQLFTTTAGALYVTFVIPPNEEAELTQQTNLFAQTGGDGLPELSCVPNGNTTKLITIELATVSIGSSRDFRKFGGMRTELPPLSIRPGNNAKLLRATDSTVWVVTCHGQPCAISLKHPGIRCRQLAASGDLQGARKLAQSALEPRFHDSLALFFSAFGQHGVSEALLLPGLSLELELALSIKCGALKRGWACLASLLAGCKDSTLLCRFPAWNQRDVDPSKLDDGRTSNSGPLDPFAVGLANTIGEPGKGLNNNQIETVLAVFTNAAGIAAPNILSRLIPTGIQGRKTAIDEAFFSSAPEGDSPKKVAKVKAPPPSTKYKPMFPRAPADETKDFQIEALADGDTYNDVIDWNMPLRKLPPEGAAKEASGSENGTDKAATGNGEANGEEEESEPASQVPETPIGANEAPDARVLELGIQLLDASVSHADVTMLQQTIKLMAPHTGIMTPAQQQRMVAAVGACGLASHLSDLTLSGTTPLMPMTALLAGFLSGDAIVASRVLEKEGLLPLKAMFMQSCGAGGLEATVEWEQHLKGLLGGPTRQLTITPTTS